jgi:transketolase
MTSLSAPNAVSATDGPGAEYAERIGPLKNPGPFSDVLVEAAKTRPEIVALSADLAEAIDLAVFAKMYPDRFFNTGVAEQNLVAVACGMARSGLVPFAATFTGFMVRRAHDFTVMQAALCRANVKLIGGVPGIQQKWGTSHAGYEDLAVMRTVPGMLVIEPADRAEVAEATRYLLDYDGPAYMRLPRTETTLPERQSNTFTPGKIAVLREGRDAVIFAAGLMVESSLAAAHQLGSEGIEATVANVSTIKPLDVSTILAQARATRAVVTAENHSIIGGLGDAVASTLASHGVLRPLQAIGLKDDFPEFGAPAYLARLNKMESSDIAEAVKRSLELADAASIR